MVMELRDYQQQCVDNTWQYWCDNPRKNPLIDMSTGAGKTIVSSFLMRKVITEVPNNPVIFIAHRKELISQTEKKLLSVWPDAPVGVYAAALGRREIKEITIASRDTLAPAMKRIGNRPSIMLLDEAQYLSPKPESRYQKIIAEYLSRNPNFCTTGMTATPYRAADGPIYGKDQFFHDICFQIKMRALIDKGFLVPFVSASIAPQAKIDVSNIPISAANGEFNQKKLAAASINFELIEKSIDEYIKHAVSTGRKHSLWFCVNIEHAKAVQACLAMRGMNYPLVTGKTPDGERQRICEEYLAGMHAGILNVGVFIEGTDFPLIDCIVNLRAMASLGNWLQAAGRGSRPSPETGKYNCLILDMGGCLDRFGPIDTATPAIKGEPDKRMKDCPECHMEVGHLKRKCPCGYEFEPPPHKVCPNGTCKNECAPSASSCAACGHIFFNHDDRASTSHAMSSPDRFVRYPITEPVKYMMKKSRNTNEFYLQFMYKSGTKKFTKNFMIGGSGFSGARSITDWQSAVMSYIRVPTSISDAIDLLSAHELEGHEQGKVFAPMGDQFKESPILKGVAQIMVDTHDKYKNIKTFTYYEKG